MKRFFAGILFCALLTAAVPLFAAFPTGSSGFSDFKADHWSIVGKNVFAEGNVHVPFEEYEIYADRAVLNLETNDIEAVGNIRFFRWKKTSGSVSPSLLGKLRRRPNLLVSTTGITGDVWGEKTIQVSASYLSDQLSAQRMAGNTKTGYFRFDSLVLQMDTLSCRAASAERFPNGTIVVKNADFSACEYLGSDNAHYSVYAASATIKPYASDLPGLQDVKTGMGEYSIFCANGLIKVYGVPLLWLPAFYKPRDQPLGLFGFQTGKDSDWGYFIKTYRRFRFSDYPDFSGKVMFDYYAKRGFGFGTEGNISTEDSRTDFFAYLINDMHPGERTDYQQYRINVPHLRYDLRLSNITHITPRLDFRAAIEYASDPYFTRDFFDWRYNADPAPATFVALEQQFDHFSASIYFRPRMNTFYTVVEKTPEIRVDVHRQEIFNTNLYYQASTTAGYDQMKWIKFNRKVGGSELENYGAFRLDTTHFLYFPVRTDYFTFVPRAGLKFLAYSQSSDQTVSDEDLLSMFAAANPINVAPHTFNSYDNKGGPCVRLAWELGFELSTKIHNTWQNVRSHFFGIDGLRHVMQPYVNYTYLDVVGRSREHLYYFDDDDRLQRQHFVRFGVQNRLQTRSGNSIRNILSMDNYWDYHFSAIDASQGEKDFSRFGNFCTILTMQPIKQLTLSTQLSLDFSNNSGDVPKTIRSNPWGTYDAGHPGLYCRWINRWLISISFRPIDDINFSVSYIYNRPYSARSAHSMGSTMTEIDAGSFFEKYYADHNERLVFSLTSPLTPDRRTRGGFQLDYDFVKGYVSKYAFFVARQFHCVEVFANISIERDTGSDSDGGWDTNFSIQAQLLNLGGSASFGENAMLEYSNKYQVSNPLGEY